MTTRRRTLKILAMIVILATVFSNFPFPSASAQGKDDLKRQFNAQTGKVSFIGPESGRSLSVAKTLGIFIRPQNPAMALAKRFGPEFGLKDPERDLSELKTNRSDNGRMSVRYRQNYQGIPVIGGELIVNTNENGDLYSINGEISPDLWVQTQPTINAEHAKQTALQAVAKWYQRAVEDFIVSEPELWIYDESLLRPSVRPVELVWRMEVTPKDMGLPIRELVLVNAERGSISLHFNQIDIAWGAIHKTESVLNTIEENPKSSGEYESTNSIAVNMPPLAGVTWYVSTTGNDSNACTSAGNPCKTINGTIGKAAAGDIIKVASGTYIGTGPEVVLINKNVTLTGGWNSAFTTQSGFSTIDGQNSRRGVQKYDGTTNLDRLIITSSTTGVANGGDLIISNSFIQNNKSSFGGGAGIHQGAGNLTLINVTVSNNSSSGSGGGIYSGGYLTLHNTTVSNNSASSGGGIYILAYNDSSLTDPVLMLNNATISENLAFNIGGGVYNSGPNTAVALQNSILARNIAISSGPDCAGYGLFVSSGYNLVGDNSSCNFNAATGDLVGTSASAIRPRLAPLQANGGLTFTQALMVGSPAIDAGNPLTPGSGGNACLSTDQRGVTRPIGTRCDIGAYEGSVAFALFPIVHTYTSNGGSSLPGTFLCNQTQPNCTNGSNPHADAVHKYAIGTYNLYATQHGRDSFDNHGMPITSSVHYCSSSNCPYDNANWTGEQMLYGDASGWPLADDVVAHEFTHGVTQYESNLFYYYQSGAINESFSDLWGEFYDQTNGQGTDTAGVKWQIGENISGLGAIRSMSDPTVFGDPDKMSSANYYEGAEDNGGVHANSGINNKAVFLMVDGGSFNGKTVTALGWEKTAAIYYEVNTNLLFSGTDYSDLYYALQQACSNLIGQKGITSGNCIEVKDAIDAVEMNGQPSPNFNPDAPYCDQGNPTTTIFSDGLESGTGNWTFTNDAYPRWQLDTPYGPYTHSGIHSLYADDYPPVITDAIARLKSLAIPSNAYLHFAHAYDFETSDNYYDGGVLEYSVNDGSIWLDAGSLIDYNGYRGTIFTGAGNPLSGRSAFVGTSHGYISTRLNLASLAGNTVTFRWRMGLDEAFSAWGWWVDDVEVYQCAAAGKVTLVAPTGIINTNQPTYKWNADNAATWYYLWVNGPSGYVFKQWYDESASCSGGICSVTPNIILSSGTYSWWVQSWSPGGYGPWSDGMTFSVPAPLPGKATLVSPTGSIGTNVPAYTWNEVSGATWYYLWINGPSGNVFKQWYNTEEANCDGSTCSVTPAGLSLSGGNYTWWIQTWSDAGYGPWSDPMTFAPAPPEKATLISPTGSIGTTTPSYSWNAVSGATWYYLWVSRVNADGSLTTIHNKWYEGAQVCSGGTCSLIPTGITLSASNYRWWVQTWNNAGYGPWSNGMTFNSP